MYKYLLVLVLFLDALYAQMAIQNVLLQRCHDSYSNVYRHLKGDKAFAYARVKLGEEDYCVWSYKASNEKNAINSALQSCRQQPINAQCKVVDVNGKWFVEDGDFSSIMPANNTPLEKVQYDALTNQAKKIVLGECLSIFNTHLQDKGHKVFAYSIDEDGNYACGSTKEHQTLRTAAIVALKICEDKRIFMEEKAPTNPCLSFSTGRKILVSAKNYKLTLDKKINRYLGQDEYRHYLREGEKYLTGACLTQYKYYLRDQDHKAFYIAQDGQGKVACGRSVGKFTVASAKKDALNKCLRSTKQEKIVAKCELFVVNYRLR